MVLYCKERKKQKMSISLEKYMGYRMDVTKETLDKDGKMN